MEQISGQQFREAIARSGLSKVEVATLLGVDRQRVYDDLRDGVSQKRLPLVHEHMGVWLRDTAGNPLDRFGTSILLAEVQRRFTELEQQLSLPSPSVRADVDEVDNGSINPAADLPASSKTSSRARGGRRSVGKRPAVQGNDAKGSVQRGRGTKDHEEI